jgi:GH24 family phage-related lysozyme (muramidase)
MDTTRALIESDEGNRSKKYQDTQGHWTIGIGHNLDANPPCAAVLQIQSAAGLRTDDQWLPAAVDAQYQYDLQANCSWLWRKPWWQQANDARQAALNDMAFNLGPATSQTFTTFYGLCATGSWATAATDLLNNTAVAKQLPKRYGRLAQILNTGSVAGIL